MKTILEGIVGSTAYGLATPESDIDKLGIYVQDTEDFHGLKLWTDKDFSIVTTNPDKTLHEVGKFCRLALRCNPTVTELLWLPEDLVTTATPEGILLRMQAKNFLSAKLVKDAYMGYAKAQLVRLEERGDFGSDLKKRTKKHARHLLRLMHQGYTVYTTGELPIRLENPEKYHEFGELVAADPSYGRTRLEDIEKQWELAKPAIPESPNTEAINNLMKSIRKANWKDK